MNSNSDLPKLILRWYAKNGRTLPWRQYVGSPYEIRIAEILLLQTTATAVEKYYPIFIKKYPDLEKLDKANVSEIEDIIKNLGLTYRAKFLKDIAHSLRSKNYILPNNQKDLMDLKGIGDYISSAILTFGFRKNTPIVDGNITRFASRFWNERDKKKIKEKLSELTRNNFLEIYFGLLDICYNFCRPPNPFCEKCPLNTICECSNGKNRIEYKTL